MLQSDRDNSGELAALLFELTQEEGNAVEIFHPNMDVEGPNSMIRMTVDWAVDTPITYTGDSVIHCLKQAKIENDKRKAEGK